MVCKDEFLNGTTMCLRPSMKKFSGPDEVEEAYIEIAKTFPKPKPFYLNRYDLLLSSTLTCEELLPSDL